MRTITETYLSNTESSITNAIKGQDKIDRQSSISPDLPKLLIALGASSLNEHLYNWLENQVPKAGMVSGRSAQPVVIEEEEEEPVDTELEYPRPNGLTYYSRKWSGVKDIDVLKTAQKIRKNVFLKGMPGTGKTALVDACFIAGLETIVVSGDTAVQDLVGDFSPNPDFGKPGEPEYLWTDGPLIRAMETGVPLLVDEIGLLDPKVGSILYAPMDGRNELKVPMNQARGIVKAVPGFFVIGASNPLAPGFQMSEALLSRMPLQVEVTTDWDLAKRLGVPTKIVDLASTLMDQVLAGNISWAPQFRELEDYRDIAKAFTPDFAMRNLLAQCPDQDFPLVSELIKRQLEGSSFKPASI
jgi:nitric oxide reductase NorQ protein